MTTTTAESPRLAKKDLQQAKDAVGRMLAGETSLSLTPPVIYVLRQMLDKIGDDGLKTAADSVSTIAAAKYLNVSRPYLVRQLKDGKIPYFMVGTHHRVYTKDLEAYKRKQDNRSSAAMQGLHDLSQELGLYDLEPLAAHE